MSLTRNGGFSAPIRRPPIDALDEHGELRRGQADRLPRSANRRPFEDPMLEPLGEMAEPGAVPVEDLDEVCLAAKKDEQVARPSMPLRMSVTPQAMCTFTPVGATIIGHLRPVRRPGAEWSRDWCRPRSADGARPPARSRIAGTACSGADAAVRGVNAARSARPSGVLVIVRGLIRCAGPMPSCLRHWNIKLVEMPYLRATPETDAFSRDASSMMRFLSVSV